MAASPLAETTARPTWTGGTGGEKRATDAVLGLTNGLGAVNAALLAIGRHLGARMVAAMVLIIPFQVFFR